MEYKYNNIKKCTRLSFYNKGLVKDNLHYFSYRNRYRMCVKKDLNSILSYYFFPFIFPSLSLKYFEQYKVMFNRVENIFKNLFLILKICFAITTRIGLLINPAYYNCTSYF